MMKWLMDVHLGSRVYLELFYVLRCLLFSENDSLYFYLFLLG